MNGGAEMSLESARNSFKQVKSFGSTDQKDKREVSEITIN